MSLALIEESAKEVRRLAIAGSPLAVGDFRLKKLIPALEQAGAKVPVFAQVARSMAALVNGSEPDSAANLLSLSTLLNAILYTQGESGADGDFRELEAYPTDRFSTRTSARALKPLVEALTSSGAGRMEVVKAACERGAFGDLRLIDPAIRALEDSYPELADLVAEKILPAYGQGIVPRLRSTLELKGKKSDARKLAIMHQLDPVGTIPLCQAALEDGSPEVKSAAIACLGKHEECLPMVLEQSNSKNKQVRAAALEALAEHDRPEVTRLFTELLKSKALDVLARPFRALRNRQVLNSLLAEGQRVFALLAAGDAEQIPRFWEILDCLEHRRDAEAEEFLQACFDADRLCRVKAPPKSTFAGTDVVVRLTSQLYRIQSPRALETVLAKRDALPPAAFPHVLCSALHTWPAERVFTEFAPLLELKKGAGKEKSEAVQQVIGRAHRDVAPCYAPMAYHLSATDDPPGPANVTWDARGLDAAIRADLPVLVCCLARPNHGAAVDYLLKLGESKQSPDAGMKVKALMRCQYPKVTDYFLGLVAQKTKGARYLDYELQLLLETARHLPRADLPKLDAFASKLDEKFVDKYLEALAPLRQSNVSDTSESPS